MVRDELLSQPLMGERYDPALLPYENFQIDFDLFKLIFMGISPWGKGVQSESLAARLFQVRIAWSSVKLNEVIRTILYFMIFSFLFCSFLMPMGILT